MLVQRKSHDIWVHYGQKKPQSGENFLSISGTRRISIKIDIKFVKKSSMNMYLVKAWSQENWTDNDEQRLRTNSYYATDSQHLYLHSTYFILFFWLQRILSKDERTKKHLHFIFMLPKLKFKINVLISQFKTVIRWILKIQQLSTSLRVLRILIFSFWENQNCFMFTCEFWIAILIRSQKKEKHIRLLLIKLCQIENYVLAVLLYGRTVTKVFDSMFIWIQITITR